MPGNRYIDDFGRIWHVYENNEVPCIHTLFLCRCGGLFASVGKNGVGSHSSGSFLLKEITADE